MLLESILVLLQNEVADLMPVKGDVVFVGDLFAGGRVDVEQALDDLLFLYRLGDNLGNVLRVDLEIADFLGVDHHDGAPLAKSGAPGPLGVHAGLPDLAFRISALKAAMTSPAPEARQPAPAQIEMQGVSGSLLDSTSCLNRSSSSGEVNRAIIFLYS